MVEKNYSYLIMESIVKDLRSKGYDALFYATKQEIYDPDFQPECTVGTFNKETTKPPPRTLKLVQYEFIHIAKISITHGNFVINGNGLYFDNIDMSDPVSIDRLYLALELLTKIAKHQYFVNDKNIDHAERIKRETVDLEIQAQFMREYHLKEAQLNDNR